MLACAATVLRGSPEGVASHVGGIGQIFPPAVAAPHTRPLDAHTCSSLQVRGRLATVSRRCNFIMLPDQALDPESHPKSSDDFKIAEKHWQGRAKTRFETCAHISLKEQPTGPGGTYPDPWDNACPIPADGDYASMNACAPVSKTKGHTTERSDRDVFLSQTGSS